MINDKIISSILALIDDELADWQRLIDKIEALGDAEDHDYDVSVDTVIMSWQDFRQKVKGLTISHEQNKN